jgi:hypothetical protein
MKVKILNKKCLYVLFKINLSEHKMVISCAFRLPCAHKMVISCAFSSQFKPEVGFSYVL